MALPRIVQQLAGRMKELLPIQTSAGAVDAEKVPATNASGVLDPTLLNAATTGNSKVLMTKPDGTIDTSVMPPGIGADTSSILTSEALAAGDLVNIWSNSGTANVRKADATTEGKEANGFVLAAFASGVAATVYHEGKVTGLTGLTPGARQYLSKTAGARTEDVTAYTTGNVVQCVGTAISASILDFERQEPITKA